jgi:hypothetical protein
LAALLKFKLDHVGEREKDMDLQQQVIVDPHICNAWWKLAMVIVNPQLDLDSLQPQEHPINTLTYIDQG